MEVEGKDLGDNQLVQQLLQVIAEFKRREYLHLSLISSLERSLAAAQSASPPWGPQGPPLTKDVREEEGAPVGASQGGDQGVLQGGPTLRGLTLDPATYLEIKTLRMRLAEAEGALERAKEAQAAHQFSGQSVTGQRLITKCKTLQQENAELGKALAEGSLQPATAQLGALKKHVLFLKNELRQLRELNADLDNDNEDLSQQLQTVFVNFSEVKAERDLLKAQVAKLEEKLKAATLSKPSRSERSYASHASPSHSRAESTRQDDPRGPRGPSRGPSADWSKGTGGNGDVLKEDKSHRHSRRVWEKEMSQEGSSRRGGGPEGPPSMIHSSRANKDDRDRGDRDRGERDRGDRDRGERDRIDRDRGERDRLDRDRGDRGDRDRGDRGDRDRGDRDRGDRDRGDRDRGDRDRGDRDRGERGRERDRDAWKEKEIHRRPSDDSGFRAGPSVAGPSRQRTSAR
ncbi:hypothetical protein Esti_004618 [Eimeria stiedai]